MPNLIRSSQHTIRFSNKDKRTELKRFLEEYRKAATSILNHLWDKPYHWSNKTLDIANGNYDCPSFISTAGLNFSNVLSARAIKCCSTQVCGIIKATTEKPRKRTYMLSKLKAQGQSTEALEATIAKQKVIKPNVQNIRAELNSICCDFLDSDGKFNGFIQLKSLGKGLSKIRIPIKFHRQANRLSSKGKLMTSFLISNTSVGFRWKLPIKPKRINGSVLGADQGYKTVVTLSDGATTPKTNVHGYSLEKITKSLSRKFKGSRAFRKTQIHRKNFIHWSINQLNFNNVREVKLENIINIGYKRRTSRLMSHWSNPIIRDKLKSKCEEERVALTLQPSAYRSQRCFSCGWVQKSNRKLKEFKCKSCGYAADADLNAAKNLTLDLPKITYDFRMKKLNLKGFHWNLEGFCFDGEAFTVPLSKNKLIV